MIQQTNSDFLTCICCNRFYNLVERVPIQLPCEDVICQQCYNIQKDQVQNQQIQCPFDITHLCDINHPIRKPLYLMRNLEKHNFHLIVCTQHPTEYANIYCKQFNKIICARCFQQEPHPHFYKDQTTHVFIDRKYFEESFEKMITINKNEIRKIQNLESYEELNQVEEQEEIKEEIVLFANELEKNQNVQQEIIIQEQKNYLEALTIQYLDENDLLKYYEFRRLIELHVSKDRIISNLLKIKGSTKLLYKATRDGFKAANFHSLCDNQGPTITFILSKSGNVFGGYTSVSWTCPQKNESYADNNSVIFQLNLNKQYEKFQHLDFAVQHNKKFLMIFGRGDIIINQDCNVNSESTSELGQTYELAKGRNPKNKLTQQYLAGSEFFQVIEIEVYQVKL
ncbi:tldc domain-containing protein [Stylonychia lemnae]|uniref:Tldc domain-containing protein n=1 Tax=Stylonychia lemnae TaxID=5949 RepID=A0A078AXE4_STYLE|nr:tldc domain-containing protein [Stylonychia lemnae]|eukprot:CDW86746.1 tldc domain-containing protein [Stylonychia lemnae]